MLEGEVLAPKYPGQFRTKQVIACYDTTLRGFNISYTGDELNFGQMSALRTKVERDVMHNGLFGSGYKCANLGIGVFLTLSLDGHDYLACQQQGRIELNDEVCNPIGGYVDSKHLSNPLEAVNEELEEEFLPVDGEERLIQLARTRRILTRPQDYFKASLFVESPYVISLLPEARYSPKGLGKMLIEGHEPEGKPEVVFEFARNSAKAMYWAHLNPDFDLHSNVSFHHSEDKFNGQTKTLETKFHPYGMLLIRLEDRKLTDEIFTLRNGKLVSHNPKGIFLSEVFLAGENSIAVQNKMLLEDFLRIQ